jgi:uncharacterized protein YxeA
VKKVLTMTLLVAFVSVLNLAMVGCDGGKKDVTVKFKDTIEQKVSKKDDKTVTVELTEKAAVDLTITATVKDGEKEKVTVTGGTIKKGENKLDLKIKTEDSKAQSYDVTVTAKGEKANGTGTFKITVN